MLLGAADAAARATAVELEPLEVEVQAQATEALEAALGAEPFARALRGRAGAQPRRGGRARAPGHAGLSPRLSGSQPRSWTVAAMFPHTLVAAYAIRFRPRHPRTTRRPRPS